MSPVHERVPVSIISRLTSGLGSLDEVLDMGIGTTCLLELGFHNRVPLPSDRSSEDVESWCLESKKGSKYTTTGVYSFKLKFNGL